MALTGYLMNGICADSETQLLTAFNVQYPVTNNGLITSVNGTIFDSVNSLIGSNFHSTNLITGAVSDVWAVINIIPCDPAIPPLGGTVFDPVLGASYWSFAMTFVFGVFLLAKNAQAIISAVKRF